MTRDEIIEAIRTSDLKPEDLGEIAAECLRIGMGRAMVNSGFDLLAGQAQPKS